MCENPLGSDLYHLEGWRLVAGQPRTMALRVDMCAAGLKDPESKMPILKASEIWCSNPLFAENLYDMRCSRNHQHAVLAGTYMGTKPNTLGTSMDLGVRIQNCISSFRNHPTAPQISSHEGLRWCIKQQWSAVAVARRRTATEDTEK